VIPERTTGGAWCDYQPLPVDTTSFVGRRSEVDEVRRSLSESRLLTMTGPGGVGKTRLALRVADCLRRAFPDGLCLVDLAELRDPALVANIVAERLGLHDHASRVVLDTVVEHLRPRRMLLVLDNCEHLVDACAPLVEAVIRGCPEVRVLATSRQSLRVPGERIMTVRPLPVPEADAVLATESAGQCESVALFVDRASAVVPGFALSEDNSAVLARLCYKLDGIPLAIELAAARLPALSLEQLEERLTQRFRLLTLGPRSGPTRHRGLQALIDWSYELCTRQERLVWSRSSVFCGSFDLEAAEHVCRGEGVEAGEVLPAIAGLVDKSVLLREAADGVVRYRLLETIREYGQEKLTRAEHAEARRRHRDWYARLVERFDAEWIGSRQVQWVGRLRREHANLRIALDYCTTRPGEAAVGLRMAVLLDGYWGIHGLHTEARHWLDNALSAEPQLTQERASALRVHGWFALLQGDFDAGKALLLEAGELAQRVGDRTTGAYVTHCWGMAALFVGDLDGAVGLLGDALVSFRAARCPRGEMFALFSLGTALGIRGDRKQAFAVLEECLTATAAAGDIYWQSYALWSMARIEELQGELVRAERHAREALRMQRRLGNKLALAFTMDILAWVMQRLGQPARAATVFGAASSVWNEIGASPECYTTFGAAHDEHLVDTRTALGEDRFRKAFCHGHGLRTEDAVDYALGAREVRDSAAAMQQDQSPLTRREEEIAALVAQGLTNKEIASRLVISRRTVETHVENCLVKLGFTSRARIATWFTAKPAGDGGS
jgi:predicted ATPase/DNA-binding CsgD family transcriptional regulator